MEYIDYECYLVPITCYYIIESLICMVHANNCQHLFEEWCDMLGIDDPQIWIAYVLCFLSAIGCIIYGLIHWNDTEDGDGN
jgi:hypothetical protein